ncbi:MAG: 4-(cytidine 5'-diphospho)-2-C-methyl-D-erythritol kinase [Bacteroidaceae bacterium]|nr:4-(cytidine 5'-diphospho)-2-C-methyl-D-erythritol kinase [Bacteroidaceae bacterium]
MIAFPNAKINIGLNVVRKRDDGYHDIETVFYPVNLQDALEISLMRPLDPSQLISRIEAGKLVQPDDALPYFKSRRKKDVLPCCQLEMSGLEGNFPAQDNLVVKAYLLLLQDFDLPPIDISLYKHIPTGAGLGGGSSDCASMLDLLNRRFNLRLRDSALERYAAKLGSDCPFFITGRPSLATGRGEILTPVKLSLAGYTILLVKPDVFVSTSQAYAGVTPKEPEVSLAESVMRPVSEWKECIKNDFEPSVFARFPILGEIKNRLYELGAEYASMTGSGSTVYGIFEKPLDNPQALFTNMFTCQRELF